MEKEKRMKKVNVLLMGSLLCGTFGVTSCSDSEHPDNVGNGTMPLVQAKIAAYEKEGTMLEGENKVEHVQACQFIDGTLAKVYDNLHFDGATCAFQLTDYKGSLYVLANTDGLIDLHELHDRRITEDEWKRTVVELKEEKEAHFFSGSLNLDEKDKSQTVLPLSIKRGVARFDIDIQTVGNASVKSLTLKNVARSAYLFSQEASHSPTGVERRDTTVAFPQPLTADTQGVLYVYEQENNGIEVSVTAVIDGEEKTLTKVLAEPLRRNTINTIIIRRDYINVNLNVTFDEWEQGSDTELEAKQRS